LTQQQKTSQILLPLGLGLLTFLCPCQVDSECKTVERSARIVDDPLGPALAIAGNVAKARNACMSPLIGERLRSDPSVIFSELVPTFWLEREVNVHLLPRPPVCDSP
jgi:hypothetical protein